MTKAVARPMRGIRHEVFTLALVASVPVALALVFPYDALGFRPAPCAGAAQASCAFVALDAAEERAVLAAARTAWQVDSKSVAGLRIDLSSGDLPPAPVRTVELRRPVRGESAAAVPFEPDKRGIYTIHGIDLISNNLFITTKYVKIIEDTEMMTVYPRLVSAEEYSIPFQKMMGDIVTRRFMLEDPFLFKGIREYQPYDSMKSINYKASARAGKWLVNMYDYTVSQKVTILLNMDRANQYYDNRLYENSIRMAASLTAAFEQEAIPVELISNGKDVFTGEPVTVESGCGTGHMHTLFESLARLEISEEVEDLSPVLEKAAEDLDADHMFLVISPFFGPDFVAAYEKLSAVHPSTEWILPVVLSDLNDPAFHGQMLASSHRNVYLWKVDAA